jgi:hypothetical protein
MSEELHIYFPVRRQLIFYSTIVGVCAAINIYFAMKHGSMVLWLTLTVLLVLFIFLFVPVLRNPRLLISGNDIKISIFGKWHSLSMSKDLYELVIKDDDVVSYRFTREGKHFQISPSTYYEADEIRGKFKEILKKNKIVASVKHL